MKRVDQCVHGHPFDEANTRWDHGRRFCRACQRRRSKEWNERNPGVQAERLREFRRLNPERAREHTAASYMRKPGSKEQKRKRMAEWAKANPDRVTEYSLRYQRRKRAVQGDRLLLREYRAVLLRDPCVYCGDPADTEDHIVPISNGDADAWENLAAACRSCNSRKGARSLLEVLLMQGGTIAKPA